MVVFDVSQDGLEMAIQSPWDTELFNSIVKLRRCLEMANYLVVTLGEEMLHSCSWVCQDRVLWVANWVLLRRWSWNERSLWWYWGEILHVHCLVLPEHRAVWGSRVILRRWWGSRVIIRRWSWNGSSSGRYSVDLSIGSPGILNWNRHPNSHSRSVKSHYLGQLVWGYLQVCYLNMAIHCWINVVIIDM